MGTIVGTPTASLGVNGGILLDWTATINSGETLLYYTVSVYDGLTNAFLGSVNLIPPATPSLGNFTTGAAVGGNQFYFTVSVVTNSGASPPSVSTNIVTLVAPPQPANTPVVAGVTNAEVDLDWNDPTDTGGAALANYVVTVFDMTLGISSVQTFPTGTSSASAVNLINGDEYIFVVQEQNVNGFLSQGLAFSPQVPVGTSNILTAVVPNPGLNNPSPQWPASIATFDTFTDFPVAPPRDVGYSFNINQLHAEVFSLEYFVGTTPFSGLPFKNLNQALSFLAYKKANLKHVHAHSSTTNKNADDHTQYALLTGKRAFRKPISAPKATKPHQLITLGQLRAYGFDLGQLKFGSNPVSGRTSGNQALHEGSWVKVAPGQQYPWTVIGGLWQGNTDANGVFSVFYNSEPGHSAFRHIVLTVKYSISYMWGDVNENAVSPTGVQGINSAKDSLTLTNSTLDHATFRVSGESFVYHTVVTGDTLWDIAEDYYGQPLDWRTIWQANPWIVDPNLIYPNQVIAIPWGPASAQRFVALLWIAVGY